MINAKGEDIDIRVLADGKELFSVIIPHKGGIRVPEKGPAIINGPDARLIRNLEINGDTKNLRIIEKNSGMEGSFPDMDSMKTEHGLTIEVQKDRVQLREGINLPD